MVIPKLKMDSNRSPAEEHTCSPSVIMQSRPGVRVKLPSFDDLDIDTWLAMYDNFLNDGGITADVTIMWKVLTKLSAPHFRTVKDLAPAKFSSEDHYKQLCNRVRQHLRLTSAERLQPPQSTLGAQFTETLTAIQRPGDFISERHK